ncbi:MAG: PHP domain-containing protein [Oscillospiraceae bacterium]|nr:PHP domain-containing protein [Oscillospiraceae bacterium]
MFKIELHMHTNHVSACSHIDAAGLAEEYYKAGYAAVAVTDHYNRDTCGFLRIDPANPGDFMGAFLDGYRRVRAECAKRGLRVYKGAELRFDECCNDYLLFGYPDELLAEPEKIFRMGVAAFAPLAREAGALLVQAHPYRGRCTPAFACYLDGLEVCNSNPNHQNRNGRAEEYAAQHRLLRLGGSDCHSAEDVGLGGILTEELPEDTAGLVRLIRSGAYTVIGAETPAL